MTAPPEPLMRLMFPARPGAKPRETWADLGLLRDIKEQATLGIAGMEAAARVMTAVAAATEAVLTDEEPYCGKHYRTPGGALDWCAEPDGHDGECGDQPRNTWAAVPFDSGHDAAALFLPERVAELLAEPPSALAALRGEIVSRMTILYRDGTAVTGDPLDPGLLDEVNADRARVIRTWDVDWTAPVIRVTNEIRFDGAPWRPDVLDVIMMAAEIDVAMREDDADDGGDDPTDSMLDDEDEDAPPPCPARHPESGAACVVKGLHDEHAYVPWSFGALGPEITWTDAEPESVSDAVRRDMAAAKPETAVAR